MEFFCELWIRWNINISLEYFEIYSGREGGKKKRKKYRSIDTFALSNPSVSRPTNNTENGRWLVRWLLSARTERGEKKENGRKIIKRSLLLRDNLFAIIFVYKYYTFFYGYFFLILSKSTVCNDKLTIWELFTRWGPNVRFIYCFSFFSFFFFKPNWVAYFLGDSLAFMAIYRQQISGHRSPSPFSWNYDVERRKRPRFVHGRVRETNCPIISSRKLCSISLTCSISFPPWKS